MKLQRPYLFDAVYRWVLDSECTPHLLVDTSIDSVMVPQHLVQDNQIILNLSPSAIVNFGSDQLSIFFSARFSGKEHTIVVPYQAMTALFAKETGQGLVFPLDVGTPPSPDNESGTSNKSPEEAVIPNSKPAKAKHKFKVVK